MRKLFVMLFLMIGVIFNVVGCTEYKEKGYTDIDNDKVNVDTVIVHTDERLETNIKMQVDENGDIIINEKATIVQIEKMESMAVNFFNIKFKLVDDNGNIIDEVLYEKWSCSGNSTESFKVNLSKLYGKEGKVIIETYGGYVTETGHSSSTTTSSTSNYNSSSSISDMDIWVYTQYCVKNSLKSPSSARFPSMSEATITRSDNGIIVSSYVDADNSFGANIRVHFIVQLDNNGDFVDINMIE